MEDESELLALRRARLETWRGMGIDPFGGAVPGAEFAAVRQRWERSTLS